METETAAKNIGGNVGSPPTKPNDVLNNYTVYLYSKLDKLIFSNIAIVKALKPTHHTLKTGSFM
jgi:hypothetical protein